MSGNNERRTRSLHSVAEIYLGSCLAQISASTVHNMISRRQAFLIEVILILDIDK